MRARKRKLQDDNPGVPTLALSHSCQDHVRTCMHDLQDLSRAAACKFDVACSGAAVERTRDRSWFRPRTIRMEPAAGCPVISEHALGRSVDRPMKYFLTEFWIACSWWCN